MGEGGRKEGGRERRKGRRELRKKVGREGEEDEWREGDPWTTMEGFWQG